MKKIKLLLLSGLIIFTGCINTNEIETTTKNQSVTTVLTTNSNITETTMQIEKTPLWLDVPGMNWEANEEGYSTLTLNKQKYEPETFKKYFFGFWKNVDNDEYFEENGNTSMSTGDVVWVTDNIVLTYHIAGGLYRMYWVDINNPDYLYKASDLSFESEDDEKITLIHYAERENITEYHKDGDYNEIYDKTLMTRFRLAALCDEYNMYPENPKSIDFKTFPFTEMSWYDENGIGHFKHDPYFLSNIYLESKNEDEIILSTRMFSMKTEKPSVTVRFRVFNDGEKWTNEVIEFVGENQTIKTTEELENSLINNIGYSIDDKGDVYINSEISGDDFDWYKKDYEIELYRKYYFGTWKYSDYSDKADTLIIDDSEKNNVYNWMTGGIYLVGENIIASISSTNEGSSIYWIDMAEPSEMYSVGASNHYEKGYWLDYNINKDHDEYSPMEILVYTKISDKVNEPQNGYLSQLKQYELMVKYGIDKDLIFDYTYINDELEIRAWKMEYYKTPSYLVSENPKKIIIKTSVMDGYSNPMIDIGVVFTLEFINDEWVRDVEVNEVD